MNKNQIKALSTLDVIKQFELITIKLVKEANSMRGETKKSQKERDVIFEELLDRCHCTKKYDSSYNIIDR